MSCLTDDAIAAFALGRLPPERAGAVEQHLRGCPDCARLVAEYAKALFQEGEGGPPEPATDLSPTVTPARPDPDAPLEPGTRISRYTIVGVTGRGGGGTVYEAYDPHLRRRVGVKLLRLEVAAGLPPEEAHARLLQEAQSMAQLSHPNVVGVHDAGVHEGQVFIVMEFVEGETLTRWLRRKPRAWREVLETFVAAGRGLAAIHAARLVHRDFKPENVLVGEDGHVRVTDFGLARPQGEAAVAASDDGQSGGSGGAGSSGAYTIAGGTPVYMSPEQFQRKARDARTDQFSFCVALFRALYGADPFGDEIRRRWAAAADSGAPLEATGVAEVGSPGAVPRAVYAVLARGLRVQPDQRFPSIEALLAELAAAAGLDRPATARRTGWWTAGLAVAVLIGAALWGWRSRGAAGARCGDGTVEAGEECDDGNRIDGDGCSISCLRCQGGDAAFVWPGNGHCYTRHDQAASWSEAHGRCAAAGGFLASFGGAAEAKAVVLALLPEQRHDTWIGLRRVSAARGFVWITGEPLAEGMTGWFMDFPKPAGADCIRQLRGGSAVIPADWPAAPCDQRRAYLCERPPWTPAPRGKRAYRVFYDRVPWEQARAACVRHGAHLARIDDAEEHAFVAARASVDVWIDARDPDGKGAFAWSNGAPVVFRSFAAGEPDNARPPNCVAIGEDDLWHDRVCSLPFAYLCEAE